MAQMQSSSWRLLALMVCCAAAIPAARAYTDPNNFNKLAAFRDSMRVRSANWAAALQTWTCPTPPANTRPAGTCDPCGESYDGNWYHMHCRGNTRGWGESGDGTKNGITTNMHITSSLVDGPVPKELCIIPTLREHDFGGQLNRGHLTGPVPHWLAKCYPALEELDLSNNRLTGTLPAYLSTMKVLSEIKVENNGLIGTIPPELGSLARLRRFQTEFNNMQGPIPASFANVAPYLTQFHIASNDYSGDLSMLAKGHLTTVTVHDNPKLCGMVPATVRFAKGYNPGGTGLGKPCPGASGAPQAAAAPAATPSTPPATNSSAQDSPAGGEGSAAAGGSPAPSTAPEVASSPAPSSAEPQASQPGSTSTDNTTQPSGTTTGNSGSSESGAGSSGSGSGASSSDTKPASEGAAQASPAP